MNYSLIKSSITLFVFLVFQITGNAQLKIIKTSDIFDEPGLGIVKITQLKNSNTVLFYLDQKEGIRVRIYNSKREFIVEKKIAYKYGDIKYIDAKNMFEVNGDLVVFLRGGDKENVFLYRFIIDGNTGDVKKEEKIGELALQKGKKNRLPTAFATPDFYIRNDPYSNYYAVSSLNNAESNKDKRVEIIWYDNNNREIKRGFYGSLYNKYLYLQFLEMNVVDSQKISFTVTYINKIDKAWERGLIVGTLNKESNTLSGVEVDFLKNMRFGLCLTRYNPITKKIILLVSSKIMTSSESIFNINLMFADPFSNTIERLVDPYPEKASRKSVEIFGAKKSYSGLPQNLYVKKDGTFSIVYEEMTFYSFKSEYGVYTGNVAVSVFNAAGEELNTYFIPKSHRIKRTIYPAYISERDMTGQSMAAQNQFKSFAFVDAYTKQYILLNDIEENEKNMENGKLNMIDGLGACDAFIYKLEGTKILPGRSLVFERPGNKHDHIMGMFAVSHFDPDTNIFVTLKRSDEDRSKRVRLVWMSAE